jgi:hypothetical protein
MSLKEEWVSLKDKKWMRETISGWISYMHQVEFVEKQIKLAEKRTGWMMYFNKGDGVVSNNVYPILKEMASEQYHNALNILDKFHSRYPHDPKISQLLEKIKRISGFLLGVVVLFKYKYLMGYVEIGRWNTYSSGAWECRVLNSHIRYLCKTIRIKFSGVTERKNPTTGVIKYEPWVRFRRPKFYFQGQKTAEKAARIRDVAKFWLKIEGRNRYNFGEEDYYYLNSVQEFHPQQSDDEIKRLVLEHAQQFLEVQQSQVTFVDQPPHVEHARVASKYITPWRITF